MPDHQSYLLSGHVDAARPRPPDEHTWKPLRFLNLYRLILAALFATLYQLDQLVSPLGTTDPLLLFATSVGYALFAILSEITIRRRIPDFLSQVYVQIAADIVAITLLMHASGGAKSGVGVLLVVSIASAGMLTEGRTARLFAAMATLAVLVEQIYAQLTGDGEFVSYPRAGLLGASLFATAILSRVLAKRIRESEELAAQRGVDLASMARLTQYIIQQMDAGVLVVDNQQDIRLMNGAAWRLLGKPATEEQRTLSSVCAQLSSRLEQWSTQPDRHEHSTFMSPGGIELLPNFIPVGSSPSAGALIFLYDASATAQEAQRLKLEGLGRLTASIAHEIRNPLGAIGHAAELLAESNHLEKPDRRLTEIITLQVHRVNAIIESVLQLGRRESSQAVPLLLRPWLERFIQEFVQTSAISPRSIEWSVEPRDLSIRFDPNHLRQILWNLCQNGLHHSGASQEGVKVSLFAGVEQGRAYLDIVDKGPGIPKENQANLFEPFFTTKGGGTGLGLYISRELAQCNRARLDYFPSDAIPGRFRISFGPPELPIGL